MEPMGLDGRPDEPEGRGIGQFVVVVALAAALGALIGFLAGARIAAPVAPDDDSPEAGFARDMVVHHAQAVEMAEVVRMRTRDLAIRTLATDITLTQQAQIGRMQGWLDVWGLPATGTIDAMTWMGHPTSGPMPGMATPEEVASLRTLSLAEMDVRFLQLMIPHHRAAVDMAEAILELTDRREVRTLASGVVESQAAEIEYMRGLLVDLGATDIAAG